MEIKSQKNFRIGLLVLGAGVLGLVGFMFVPADRIEDFRSLINLIFGFLVGGGTVAAGKSLGR